MTSSRQVCVLQARQALKQYQEAGVSLSECSVASDGFGSWPVYDNQGRLLSYEVLLPTMLAWHQVAAGSF